MRWLVKLITPKHGLLLDPFAGSGTTCIAAKLELMNYTGIEQVEHYCHIAEARIAAWHPDQYIVQTLFE
jgi:site-specific DNA-methyltransferase (adenine-specific)